MEDHFNTLYSRWRVLDNAVHFCRDSLIQPSQQPQLQITDPNNQETQLPGQQNGMLQHNNHYQPMQQMTYPYNYWQSTPQHNQMHYGQQNYQQQSLPSNKGYQSHHVSRWQNLPNQTVYPLRPNYMNSKYYASSEPKEQNSTPTSFAKNPQTLEGFRQEASKAELAARVTAKPEVSDTQAVTNYTMLTAIQDLTRNVQALRMLM
ncbi:uncharacterized protein [Magallana gigas]